MLIEKKIDSGLTFSSKIANRRFNHNMPNPWLQVLTAFPGIWSERDYDQFQPQAYAKSKPSEFAGWYGRQPQVLKRLITPLKADARWAVIEYITQVWEENEIRNLNPKRYILCIDPKSSFAGNLYRISGGNKKLGLYRKFALSAVWRPFHTMAKTLYHAAMIGVAIAIFDSLRKKSSPKILCQRVVRTLVDIVRTPLYETILTIVALTAVISAPFQPTLLYDFRALTAQLTHELHWGKRYSPPMNLTPCMARVANIMDCEKWERRQYKNICYMDPNNPTLVALENLPHIHR
jgi:hypothetical protein